MTRLWSLWVDYCDRIPYPPSQRRFASDIGMSPTAFGNWQQAISKLPDRMNLARFARQIGMPYERVLDAALRDSGYLPEPIEEGGGVRAGSAAPSQAAEPELPEQAGEPSGDDDAWLDEDITWTEGDEDPDEADTPQVRPIRRGMPGGVAPAAEAAREVDEEPGVTKARREHDEETERIEEDRTGMEPL